VRKRLFQGKKKKGEQLQIINKRDKKQLSSFASGKRWRVLGKGRKKFSIRLEQQHGEVGAVFWEAGRIPGVLTQGLIRRKAFRKGGKGIFQGKEKH